MLLVEDNPGDIRLVEEYLKDSSNSWHQFFLNHIAGNITEAKDVLSLYKIDVVLLDLSLPDSSGLTTLNQIWKVNSTIPIIILTGMDDQELALRAVHQGAQDYLAKSELTAPLLAKTIHYSVERKRAEEMQRFLATHDFLTELPNRSLYYDRAESALIRSRRRGGGKTDKSGVALMVIDVDHFKSINDLHGHVVGDEVLKEIAKRMKSTIRDSDTIARLGGDEFTIILEGIENSEDCRRVAEKILETIRNPFILDSKIINLSVSIGISLFPADGQDVATLIKYADIAMYDIKKTRNGYQFYSE